MKKIILLFALLFIPVVVLVTACGSSNSPTSPGPTPTPTATPNPSLSDVFVAQFGGNLSFNSPQGLCGNSAGSTLYVSDTSANYVYAYTSAGVQLFRFGGSGAGNGTFSGPEGVAVDSSGNVYVADSGNNLVQKFSSSGSFLLQWGGAGSANGQFQSPYGVAVNQASTTVYVSDQTNLRIQAFTTGGTYVNHWSTPYPPYGVAVDASGNVYVASYNGINSVVGKYNAAGTLQTSWGGANGSGNGNLNGARGVAVDNQGNVVVADTGNNLVQRFSNAGTFLVQWGGGGLGSGKFSGPVMLWVDAVGNVYVADSGNHLIQQFFY